MSTEQKKEEPAHLVHWRSLMKSVYLGSHDFQPGQEFKVVVESISKETIKNAEGKPEDVVLARFVKAQKPMIVNKTNMKAMAKIFQSNYIEDWTGKSVCLFVQKVQAFGEWVEAIRVKAEKSITIEDLTTLFEAKKANLTPDDIKTAERIIGNKEVGSYGKLKKLLDSK